MPTDYITKTCGYTIMERNEVVEKEVMQFIGSIFENENLVNYVLDVFATALCGHKHVHEFYIFTGSGRNGKGHLMKLVKTAFQEYMVDIDSGLL